MKNARGCILLLHQKGSSPLGLQPLNKYCFLRNHVLACRKYSFQGDLIGSSEELLEIQGIHTGSSGIHVVSWRFGDSIASSGFSVVGISEFWDGNGFLGSGLLRPDGEKCEPSSLYFPIPKHPENILQPSRKHITGFLKTLPTLQKTSSKVFRKNLTFIQKVSFKSPQKVSFKSFQQSYSKSPESKLQTSRNPFSPNRQES